MFVASTKQDCDFFFRKEDMYLNLIIKESFVTKYLIGRDQIIKYVSDLSTCSISVFCVNTVTNQCGRRNNFKMKTDYFLIFDCMNYLATSATFFPTIIFN